LPCLSSFFLFFVALFNVLQLERAGSERTRFGVFNLSFISL